LTFLMHKLLTFAFLVILLSANDVSGKMAIGFKKNEANKHLIVKPAAPK